MPQQSVSIGTFYTLGTRYASGEIGSAAGFLEELIRTLENDPIRTRSLARKIEDQGLRVLISPEWPLNDFYTALENYFQFIGSDGKLPQIDIFRKAVFDIVDE